MGSPFVLTMVGMAIAAAPALAGRGGPGRQTAAGAALLYLDDLEKLVAPAALYPDTLLMQILIASG